MTSMKVPDHLHLARDCQDGLCFPARYQWSVLRQAGRRGVCFALWILVVMGWVPVLQAASEQEIPGLQVGQEIDAAARDLPMVDVTAPEGTPAVRLEQLRGSGGLLLIFSSNTCPYVLDWLDRLPRLAVRGGEHGVPLVVVNANERKRRSTDAPEAMTALWQEHGFVFPYLVDRDAALADALGAQRTPEVFLFDGAWTLVYRGAIDDLSGPFGEVTQHYAEDALRQMLGQEPVLLPTADAVGCAIQRPRLRARNPPNREE